MVACGPKIRGGAPLETENGVMSERRSEVRRRTLFAGRLAANHLMTRDCVVRDMSSRGARLLCRTTGLCDEVALEIRTADGFKKGARIVWRRLKDCGVEFAS
jgi:hypothetical protein